MFAYPQRAFGGEPEEAVRVLAERTVAVLAVDLRGGGEEQAPAVARRRMGDDVGAADVAKQRLERVVDDQLDADGGGEMEAGVGPLDQLIDESASSTDPSTNTAWPVSSRWTMFSRRPVLRSSRMTTSLPARDQGVGQMRADEASTSRDQIIHPSP